MDKDQADVAAACTALKDAMLTADRAKLAGLCADALSYGHSNGRVEGKAEFIEANALQPAIWKSISVSDQSVHTSGDTAIVRHVMSAETERDGNASSVRIGVLLIWQRQAGAWKLIARQAVKS